MNENPDSLTRKAFLAQATAEREHLADQEQTATTDRADLRDHIAKGLLDHLSRTADIRPSKAGPLAFMPEVTDKERLRLADAVLAVLPASIDRGAVRAEAFREAAVAVRRGAFADTFDRMADETPQPETEAYPPETSWQIENQWHTGDWRSWALRTEHDDAVREFEGVKDGKHAWRLVRFDTTTAVEAEHAPAAPAQPDGEAEGPRTVCVCGHTRSEHLTVSGRLLCDECDPDSTENLVCKEFEAL